MLSHTTAFVLILAALPAITVGQICNSPPLCCQITTTAGHTDAAKLLDTLSLGLKPGFPIGLDCAKADLDSSWYVVSL